MKKLEGNQLYVLMLFFGVLLVSLAVDLGRHTFASAGPVPPHSHVTLEQFAILALCALLFATERLQLYRLNLNLYFLSIILIFARVAFTMQTLNWRAASWVDLSLFLLLGVLVLLARYPLFRVKEEYSRQAA